MTEVDLIQIRFQYLVLRIPLLQLQRTVYLGDFALDRDLVVAGNILHQLLGDG